MFGTRIEHKVYTEVATTHMRISSCLTPCRNQQKDCPPQLPRLVVPSQKFSEELSATSPGLRQWMESLSESSVRELII